MAERPPRRRRRRQQQDEVRPAEPRAAAGRSASAGVVDTPPAMTAASGRAEAAASADRRAVRGATDGRRPGTHRRNAVPGTHDGRGRPEGRGRTDGRGACRWPREYRGPGPDGRPRASGESRRDRSAAAIAAARRAAARRSGARARAGDEASPTRSGIQYPPRRTVRRDAEPRRRLRRCGGRCCARSKAAPAAESEGEARPQAGARPPRRAATPAAALDRGRRRARADRRSRRDRRAQDQLARAAEAFAAGRERDAARLLRPLRDAYPDAAAVRELLGLVHYRLGQLPGRDARSSTAFADLTGSVEQHPVLMDCWRAQRRYDRSRRCGRSSRSRRHQRRS